MIGGLIQKTRATILFISLEFSNALL